MKIYGDVNVESGSEFNTTPETPSISSNTLVLDCSKGNIFVVNQNANINTLTLSNPQDGQHIKLLLQQSANGWTITWPGSFYFIGGNTLDASSGQINQLTATYSSALGGIWVAMLETNNAAGSGTVTSVALTDGSTTPIYTVSGSPITGSGTLTLTLNTENSNKVLAGPASGSAAQPTFRSLVWNDIPNLTYEEQTATAAQTVFNTTNVTTLANTSSKTYMEVFVNGVYQQQGSTKAYQVTGANQITFNAGLSLNSDVVFVGFA